MYLHPSAAVFSAAAVTTRSLVQQQQLTTSIQLLQRPGPGQWLNATSLHLQCPTLAYTGPDSIKLCRCGGCVRCGRESRAVVVELQSGPSHLQPSQGPCLMMSSREQRALGNISSVDVLGFRLTYYKTQSLLYLQCLTIDGFFKGILKCLESQKIKRSLTHYRYNLNSSKV